MHLKAITHAVRALSALLLVQAAHAQGTSPETDAQKKDKDKQQLERVEVTGIRATMEKSMTQKLNASANVDVITAVDVGKMPDKNLADSLQRVVGLAVRTDYDEAEKVAIRGANPDMSLILFNGHTVSGGDWYISDQNSSSRSTSLSLMPSSVLNSATVYKTSQANIVDGGMAGTVNVTTRRPLDARQRFGGVVSVGGVYADLPRKTGPQLNASLNWKNEANTFGVIGQVFSEKRYVRRDSVSRFAYGVNSGWDVIDITRMKGITDASLAGTGLKAADLQGVRIPGSMSSEFVEGVRDRMGGMLTAQLKATPDLEFGITAFQSKMKSENYGRLTSGGLYSMLTAGADPVSGQFRAAPGGTGVFASLRNPVIVQQTTIYGDTLKVLKGAEVLFPTGTVPQYVGNSEGFFRSGAYATSGFLDLDAKWRVNESLSFKGLVSTTRGVGNTELDRGLTYSRFGQGATYMFNGLDKAPDFAFIGAGTNTPTLNADGSGYLLTARSQPTGYKTIDRETSVAVDGEYVLDKGAFTTMEFGVRHADHHRDHRRRAPQYKSAVMVAPDSSKAAPYPSDFGAGLGGGNWDNTGFYYPADVLRGYYDDKLKATTPEWERRVAAEIEMRERQTAAYVMQSFETDNRRFSGNFGLRFVQTRVDAQIATPIAATICPKIEPGKPAAPCAAFPTAINTAGDGGQYFDDRPFNPNAGTVYYKVPVSNTFNHILPSVNLRMAFTPTVIARIGASQTIGRQNYNLYGAGFSGQTCTAAGCTVNGPNPNLKPMTSTNFDASLSWNFAKGALVQVSIFDSQISGYPKTGAVKQGVTVDLIDPLNNQVKTYFINTSEQQKARLSGFELGYEQPIWGGFGVTANYSYADTSVEDGRPMTGASKHAANLGAYFENDQFSVRLVYNYRSEYVNSTTAPAPTANSQGLSVINGVAMPAAPFMAAPVSNVALSANWNITPQWQLSFNATNLTNPTRATYRYSEQEPQKLDVSGRQYYVEARYKF